MRLMAGIVMAWALIAAAPGPAENDDPVRAGAAADSAYLVALYKDLHAAPELSFQEVKTAARLARELRPLGFEVTEKVGGTGVVAVMKNGNGPVLMIRTDMDALPVTEDTGLSYASKVRASLPDGGETGVMHACGHDIHMAVWVGAARRMAAMRDQWSGTLVMVGQPAEEQSGGAVAMIKDGLYTRFPKPTHALALHDHAALPAGMLAYTQGYALANVDTVEVTIRGIGGHGAYPHLTKDPVVLAARTVVALQTLVARENDPQSPAVVTVGAINGGTRPNIIPDEVKLQLTVRSYAPEVRQRLLDGIRRVAEGEALAAGMPKDRMPVVTITPEAPATFNTDKLTRQVADVLTVRFGRDRVIQIPPTMGGEDFSQYWMADKDIESTLFWLGAVKQSAYEAARGDAQKLPSLHSAKFAPDPAPTIRAGVEAMTAAGLSVLGTPKGGAAVAMLRRR